MSKLELNIYKETTNENNETFLEVEKTYKTDTDNLLMSSLEDFLIAYEEETGVKQETKDEDEDSARDTFVKSVKQQRNQVKETAKRIFPNITDEELAKTKIAEINELALKVMTFVLAEAGIETEKNQ